MGVRSKTIVTLALVLTVGAALGLQNNDSSLFQGQLELNNNEQVEGESESPSGDNQLTVLRPDLTADLRIIAPDNVDGDITLDVTIKNTGQGAVDGSTPFSYEIFVNDQSIFSNTDSFTQMEPGDSFNFQYPVSRLIYSYPDNGTAKVVIDESNAVSESDESNNEISTDYFL